MNTGHGHKNLRPLEKFPFNAEVYRPSEEKAENTADIERSALQREVRALRTLLARPVADQDLGREIAAMRMALEDVAVLAGHGKKNDRFASLLRARGIDGTLAARLATIARESEEEEPLAKMMTAITETIELAPWSDDAPGRRAVAFVGTAGVGKTTTIAKLATRARVAGKSVSLVSCDGFRVGAVEQLARYAELLGAQYHVARTTSELEKILGESASDVVFVDTSGRAPSANAPEPILPARRKLQTPIPLEVVLCMSAATRGVDAAQIVSAFAPLGPTSVCVTKIDETVAPSGVLYAPWTAKRPLSILCNGPRVPEDIEPANAEAITKVFANEGSAT